MLYLRTLTSIKQENYENIIPVTICRRLWLFGANLWTLDSRSLKVQGWPSVSQRGRAASICQCSPAPQSVTSLCQFKLLSSIQPLQYAICDMQVDCKPRELPTERICRFASCRVGALSFTLLFSVSFLCRYCSASTIPKRCRHQKRILISNFVSMSPHEVCVSRRLFFSTSADLSIRMGEMSRIPIHLTQQKMQKLAA